jgi:hypothetical protein
MANEPERPIEQLLRAAAKKRRDEAGAPLELHPATRRLLQGEVARQFAPAQPEAHPPLPLLMRLCPRWTWAVAICAVLSVAVALLLREESNVHKELLLAENEMAQKSRLSNEPMPRTLADTAALAPQSQGSLPPIAGWDADQAGARRLEPSTPAPQPEVAVQSLAKDSLVAMTDKRLQTEQAMPAPTALAEQPKGAEAQLAASGAAAASTPAVITEDAFQRRYGLAVSPPPPARAPAAPVATASVGVPLVATDKSESLTLAESAPSGSAFSFRSPAASANGPKPSSEAVDRLAMAKVSAQARKDAKSGSVVQHFVQVSPSRSAKAAFGDEAKAAQSVLVSFQVEQADQELRITDVDGSVYAGYLQVSGPVRRLRPAKVEAPAAAPASKVAAKALEPSGLAGADSSQDAFQSHSFRVAGTNRTLQKKVVFTGNLIAATNLTRLPPTATNLAGRSRVGDAWGGSLQPGLLPLLNSRINGKVVIGNGAPIEVNALPAKP